MFIVQSPVAEIDVDRLPTPEQYLLDHLESMTCRLERYHRQPMRIEILESLITADDVYEREILMLGVDDNQPKQLAHIRILLKRIAELRDKVLTGATPFGRILAEAGVQTMPQDVRFLRFAGTPSMCQHFKSEKNVYFGRRYRLAMTCGVTLASVTEVLP